MTRLINKVLPGVLIASLVSAAFAGSNAPGPLPMSTVLQTLNTAGYSTIKKIEFDDGTYKAKAIGSAGQEIKVKVSATGSIVSPKTHDTYLSILDVSKKLEGQGYKIQKIDFDDGKYEVKALAKDATTVEKVDVNAKTGEIKKD